MILSPRDALLFSIACLNPEIAHTVVPIREHLLDQVVLRDYQLAMLLAAAAHMRNGVRRVLLQLPTGAGKTVMAAQMLSSAAHLDMRSQFLVHRKELIKQTSKTFTETGIDHGFIAAGRPMSFDAEVTLAGVQTLAKRLDIVLPPRLAVLDECHHATAATWARVLEAYEDAFIVGLTATPQRLDGRGLDDHFDVMVQGPSVAELIARGFLSPFDYYAPTIPDMTGVPSLGGDFNKAGVEHVMDKPALIGDIVEHYLRLAAGQQGIGFAASREHSRKIVDAFRAHGVRAAHVDGDMDKERERLDEAFRAGDVDLLSNVDLFGEGYDVPGIVYCGLWRPTKSLALHKQQCGRALRPAPGKERAIICDHAGNAIRLGDLPDTEREWSLQGRAARPRGTGNSDAEPVRQCLTCYRVSPSTVAVCPGCDEPFPAQMREIKVKPGQLERLHAIEEKKRVAAVRKAEEKACKEYADFYHLAVARGYENPVGWARMRAKFKSNYAARFR